LEILHDAETIASDHQQTSGESKLSHKKKEVENIVQDVFDFTVDESEENMTKISLTGREENNCQENSSGVLQDIARLNENACIAVKVNQAEILCWIKFITGLDRSIDEILNKDKVGMKKAKGLIYDFIIAQNPGTKRATLYQYTVSVKPGRFMSFSKR
jgi:hypothetical protein